MNYQLQIHPLVIPLKYPYNNNNNNVAAQDQALQTKYYATEILLCVKLKSLYVTLHYVLLRT